MNTDSQQNMSVSTVKRTWFAATQVFLVSNLIAGAHGPVSQEVALQQYASVRYVAQSTGSDTAGDGSVERPWQSLTHALARISDAAANKRYAVLVARGTYAEPTLHMKPHVDLYGGFNPDDWQRDIFAHRTILDGEGQRRVLVGADSARLDGFVIRNGRVRGKGAGLLCLAVSPEVTNNVFLGNKTLAPEGWNPKYRHEIGNDGAAIYCENGAAPVIANNVFAHNQTEVGRGGGVALHGRCDATIRRNIFLYNTVGLKDPRRSSDGGALSIFDWSSPVVEENVFLSNEALTKNDAGGVFAALWSSPVIRNNLFVGNQCDDDAGGLFVGGQEHRYDRPLDPLPPAGRFFVDIVGNLFVGNRNPSMNSGAMRLTMETRGRFANNVVAHNTGIYFQRSEVLVVNNTILEPFLFVETKEGLKPGAIVNNIIWGEFNLTTETPVTYCNIKSGYPGEGNIRAEPGFVDDGEQWLVASAVYYPKKFVTMLHVPGATWPPDALVSRVVKAGERWGVVRANGRTDLEVWGDLSGEVVVTILPTYHLRPDSPCIDAGTSAQAPNQDMEGEARPQGREVDIGADEVRRE